MEKRLNTIAMYLPQYHRVPENDKWWGEGFTEWTSVKAAERLFEGHVQPRIPLDQNYYNLLDKRVMEWQAGLAKEFGIDGFCFYHYYFKDGKKILEKPMENLLKWKDLDMPYCCCWANQTWARTWSNLYAVNTWSEKFEPKDSNENPILLEQSYGGQAEWEEHFDYLLPFFLDERYLKMDGKPIFLFYTPEDISELAQMLECWNSRIQDYGYDGIYAVGVNSMKIVRGLSARLFQGPSSYMRPLIAGKAVREILQEGVKAFDYQECWDNAINLNSPDSFRTYYGGFVDYDDTPRRGKLGLTAAGAAPDIFGSNLYKLAIKNIALGNQWLFINAWNEWGEGNYLEPDERNKFQYLEMVRTVMEKCNGEHLDVQKEWDSICASNTMNNDTMALVKELRKYREFYKLLNRWLTLKEQGVSLEKYFTDRGYYKILIYGMAGLGKHLYEEVGYDKLEVVGALDRRQGITYKDLKFYSLDGEIPKCDVIVVTAISDFETIKEFLSKKVDSPIVSLKDIIDSLL